MKAIEFKEQNVVYAKNQPKYLPLPAYKYKGEVDGRIVFCWKPTFWERIKILFCGRIWHQVLTFDAKLQPQRLTIKKPEMPDGKRN